MLRPLYLHIGLHKTGTTTIQQLLQAGGEEFRRAGYGVVSQLGRAAPGHHFQVAVLETEGPEAFAHSLGGTEGDAVLFSCERLCKLFRKPKLSRETLEALSRHFRVIVMLSLRRQDFLKESVYAEVVKKSYNPDIRTGTVYKYDIGPLMQNLEAAVGRENVALSLYRDDQRGGGDIAGSFLRAIGWEDGAPLLPPLPRLNTSLHRRARLFLGQVDKPNRRFANSLVDAVRASDVIVDDRQPELMSPADRAAFLLPFLPENRTYAEAYGFDGAEFYSTLPEDDGTWFPPAPITAAEFADVRERLAIPIQHSMVFEG